MLRLRRFIYHNLYKLASLVPPPPRDPPPRSGESGAAIVIAIFILAILLSLIISLAGSAQVDLRASTNYTDSIQNDALLDAAFAHAMALIQSDYTPGQDTLEEDWTLDGADSGVYFPMGEGVYQFQILDASARLNLNTATQEQLLALPGMTEELADSILDWRDEDDDPNANGAESDTYQNYPRPYYAKNAPFDAIEELLMVQGMYPEILYGDPTTEESLLYDPETLSIQSGVQPPLAELLTIRSYEPNESAEGEPRQNLNEASPQEIAESLEIQLTEEIEDALEEKQGNYESVAELLDIQGVNREALRLSYDLFTTSEAETLEGRINVNTASADVLMTLPEMTEESVESILANRPFDTVSDLLDEGILEDSVFRQIAGSISTKSSVFIIRARAVVRPGGQVAAAEILVERTPDGMQLLRRRSVARWPGWLSWGWPDDILYTEAVI